MTEDSNIKKPSDPDIKKPSDPDIKKPSDPDNKKPSDPDDVIFEIIFRSMGTDDEGSNIVDFARSKEINFKFHWGVDKAEWHPRENMLLCGRGYSSDDALGAISRQLRHAVHSDTLPNIDNMHDERLAKTSLRQQILLLRLTEGDAKSYELAMRVALQNSGAIKDAAASFSGMFRTEAENIQNNSLNTYGINTARFELYKYAKEFEKKYSSDPFAPAARADAFFFLQQSRMFCNEYDDAFMMKFYFKCHGHKSTKETFDYAAQKPLPDFKHAAQVLSICTVSGKTGSYLTQHDVEGLESHISERLNVRLQELILMAEGNVTLHNPPKSAKNDGFQDFKS